MISRATIAYLLVPALLAAILLGCSGGSSSSGGDQNGGESIGSESQGSGQSVEVGGTKALVWGDGERGVVLSHGAIYDAASWKPQARKIAGSGAVVLAVEDTTQESIEAATQYLKKERGAKSIALIGASAGSGPVLDAAGDSGIADQVMLLSGTGDVSNLGDYPKLFVASEGEGLASQVRQMAKDAPGDNNKALILPGSAHAQAIFDSDAGDKLLQTIVERLKEYG